MAYLSNKNYTYDIVISYAHLDNRPFNNLADGIITFFSEKLQIAIEGVLGPEIKIWRDNTITETEDFQETIDKVFKSSAICISCLTRTYTKRRKCKEELNSFFKKVQEKGDPFGLRVNNKVRLVNCLFYDLPIAEWPDHFQGRRFFKFFGDDGFPLDPHSNQFNDVIKALAKEVSEILSMMYNMGVRKEVFVAYSTPNVRRYREEVSDALRPKLRLQPYELLPKMERNHREKVSYLLTTVCSSIHLYGEDSGNSSASVISTTKTTFLYHRWQIEEALKTEVPQLVWYDQDHLEDPFIEQLKRSPKRGLRIHPGSPANICHDVEVWVNNNLSARTVKPHYLLIDCKEEEISDKDDIKECLARLGIARQILNFTRRDDFDESLSEVSQYIIIVRESPSTSIERLKIVLSKLNMHAKNIKRIGVYISLEAEFIDEGDGESDEDLTFLRICESQSSNENTRVKVIIYDGNKRFRHIHSIDQFLKILTEV